MHVHAYVLYIQICMNIKFPVHADSNVVYYHLSKVLMLKPMDFMQSFLMQYIIIKPGERWPQAGAHLVSRN